MAKKKSVPEKDTMVRILPAVKRKLKLRMAQIADESQSSYQGKDATQELITEALWLWFSSIPLAEAVEFLDREFRTLGEFKLTNAVSHEGEKEIGTVKKRKTPAPKRKGKGTAFGSGGSGFLSSIAGFRSAT